jgi:hypothetical protein
MKAKPGRARAASFTIALALAVATLPACVDRSAAASDLMTPATAAALADLRCTSQAQWRLYFGLDSPSGPLSAEAWDGFVAQEIAPRLPAGYTLMAALGQWRGADGRVQQEASRVLEVVADDKLGSRRALAEIAVIYKSRFQQQAVLISETDTRVCR